MLTFKELIEKKTKVKINPKVEDLKEKSKCNCDCNQNPCIKCGVDHHVGPKSDLSQQVKENAYESQDKISEERPEESGAENLLTFNELNRYAKETGKNTGSLNKRPGSPSKKGGTKDPVMRAVRTSIRKQTGKPEGQHKKEKGKKPPVAGEYGARRTPKDIVLNRRAQKKAADDAMRDTRGT